MNSSQRKPNGTEPYTKYPNWFFGSPLPPNVREVYMVLCSHAWGNKVEVFPGVERIAEMAELSRSTVKRSLSVLEALGMVTVQRKPPAVNHYFLRHLSGSEIARICGMSRAEVTKLGESSTVSTGSEGTGSEAPTGSGGTVEPVQGEPVDRFRVSPEADQKEEDERELDEVDGWAGASARLTPNGQKIPPPAGPEKEEHVEASGKTKDPRAVSPSNYRNTLRNHVDAESLVVLWEELRGPAPRASTRESWIKSVVHLLKDGHRVDEIRELTRWVAADDYWSARISSPYGLRLDGHKKPRYADLLAESQSRKPKRRAVRPERTDSDLLDDQKARAALGLLSDMGSPEDSSARPDWQQSVPHLPLDGRADATGDFASLKEKLAAFRNVQ